MDRRFTHPVAISVPAPEASRGLFEYGLLLAVVTFTAVVGLFNAVGVPLG